MDDLETQSGPPLRRREERCERLRSKGARSQGARRERPQREDARPGLLRAVLALAGRYRNGLRGLGANAQHYLWAAVLQNVGYGIIATTFAIHLKDSGFSESVIGDVEAALALSAAAVCLLLPPLVASVGYRRLLMFAGLALGIARLGQAYAPSASLVIMLGLVFGLGEGVMQTLSTAFLSENAGRGSRTGLVTADFVARVAAGVVGALLGGFVPPLLTPFTGYEEAVRLSVVLAAGLMASSAIAAGRIEDHLRRKGSRQLGWLASLKGFRSWGRVGRLLVPEVLISLGAGLVMPFVALFLQRELGASVPEIGAIQAVSAVAMVIAALTTPWIARRVGLAGTVVITELASLPFLVLIPFAPNLPAAAVLFWLRGMLMNMSWPIYNQLSMEGLPSEDKPLVAGWVRFGWSMAWFAGSVIGGRMMEYSYRVPYFFTAVLYGLGAVATFLLLRKIETAARTAGKRDA